MKFQKFLTLSDVYKYEEDFSRDLAQHLDEFLERVSITGFEDAETEARVGTHQAGVIATNLDQVLVVENQFGQATWQHWGQLEAYARIKSATTAILIADEFEELMIETCNLRNADSDIDWFLIQVQVTEHEELHPIKAAGPQSDIQAEKGRKVEYNEFWDPIRLGDGVFSGKRVLAQSGNGVGKTVNGVGILLNAGNHSSRVHIYTQGEGMIEKRDRVYNLITELDYEGDKAESSKHAFINIPIMDKGQADEEYWDEIRETLERVGTEVYRKLEEASL